MSYPKRSYILKLNAYELGWLFALTDNKRMYSEMPTMWLQFQIETNQVYADSEGHPAQKQAKKDVKKFKALLKRELKREEE